MDFLSVPDAYQFSASENFSGRLFRGDAYQLGARAPGSGTLISRGRLSAVEAAGDSPGNLRPTERNAGIFRGTVIKLGPRRPGPGRLFRGDAYQVRRLLACFGTLSFGTLKQKSV